MVAEREILNLCPAASFHPDVKEGGSPAGGSEGEGGEPNSSGAACCLEGDQCKNIFHHNQNTLTLRPLKANPLKCSYVDTVEFRLHLCLGNARPYFEQ